MSCCSLVTSEYASKSWSNFFHFLWNSLSKYDWYSWRSLFSTIKLSTSSNYSQFSIYLVSIDLKSKSSSVINSFSLESYTIRIASSELSRKKGLIYVQISNSEGKNSSLIVKACPYTLLVSNYYMSSPSRLGSEVWDSIWTKFRLSEVSPVFVQVVLLLLLDG